MTTAREMRTALKSIGLTYRLRYAKANLMDPECSQCAGTRRPKSVCPLPQHWSGERLKHAYATLCGGTAQQQAAPKAEPAPIPSSPNVQPRDTVAPIPATGGGLLEQAIAEAVAAAAIPALDAMKGKAEAQIQQAVQAALEAATDAANRAQAASALALEKAEAVANWTPPPPSYKGIQIQTAAPAKVTKLDGTYHPKFDTVVRLAALEGIVYLVGPAGTGKTFMAQQVADALGRPFYFDSVTAGTSEGNLSGWLIPVGKAGKFVYVPVGFVKAYEEGGVYLADEFDAIDPTVAVFLNAALANGKFSLPKRHENPVAKRHPDFVFLAAANTFGTGADALYVGRSHLDAATMDRFTGCMVEIEYDPALEEQIAHSESGGDAKLATEALTFTRTVRQTIRDKRLHRIASYRMIARYARQRANGFTRTEVTSRALHAWSADERAKLPETVTSFIER